MTASSSSPASAPRTATAILQRHATAIAGVLFLVLGTSGLLLFFDLGKGLLSELHEWFGLAFVLAVVLHLVRNRKPFVRLLWQRRTHALLLAAGLAAAAFVLPAATGGSGGGSPMRQFTAQAAQAPLDRLAPVLGLTPEALVARLQAAGFKVEGSDATLAGLAAAQGVELPRLFAAALHTPATVAD